LQTRLQVDELQAVLLEDIVDGFLLLGREIQSLNPWKGGAGKAKAMAGFIRSPSLTAIA
jgi:hypothetical protein